MGLYPRMHQTSNSRYNLNGYGSLRVVPIACGFEAPKRHGKKDGFLSICILILSSVIINNKDLLKTRLIFKFNAQISCKNNWNNLLLLNTNAPLICDNLQLLKMFHQGLFPCLTDEEDELRGIRNTC